MKPDKRTTNKSKFMNYHDPFKFSREKLCDKEELHLYEPCSDKKGLHCEGDDFLYIVDWEIHEEI